MDLFPDLVEPTDDLLAAINEREVAAGPLRKARDRLVKKRRLLRPLEDDLTDAKALFAAVEADTEPLFAAYKEQVSIAAAKARRKVLGLD